MTLIKMQRSAMLWKGDMDKNVVEIMNMSADLLNESTQKVAVLTKALEEIAKANNWQADLARVALRTVEVSA
jgi:hypothetical protein